MNDHLQKLEKFLSLNYQTRETSNLQSKHCQIEMESKKRVKVKIMDCLKMGMYFKINSFFFNKMKLFQFGNYFLISKL